MLTIAAIALGTSLSALYAFALHHASQCDTRYRSVVHARLSTIAARYLPPPRDSITGRFISRTH